MAKTSLREVEELAQGHTAGKWLRQDFNPSRKASNSQILFRTLALLPQGRALLFLKPQVDHCGVSWVRQKDPDKGNSFQLGSAEAAVAPAASEQPAGASSGWYRKSQRSGAKREKCLRTERAGGRRDVETPRLPGSGARPE